MGRHPFPLPEGQAGILPHCSEGQLGVQLETGQLPRPQSRAIKLTLPSSATEAAAKGATGKRKGSRQKPESSRQHC